MMLFEYLSFFLFIFTSLVGIFYIVKIITDWIFDENEQLCPILLIGMREHDDKLEMSLRSFLAKNNGQIILVDFGVDAQMLEIIQALKGDRENITIVKDYELCQTIHEFL